MAAALESGEYEPTTTYDCGLEFTELPGITLYDWRFERELPASGVISLIGGLERSCNPWFYHIGLDLYNKGYESAIPDMAVGFGLGSPTGIEIGDEAGQVPSPENSQETLGEDWAPRHPVQLAIGQSALQVTPIQVVRYAAALGNGGTLYRPQLVQRIENAEGVVLQEFEPDAQGELPVSEDTLAAIQQGMINVIQKEGATAYRKFLGLNLNVAGKTGTAQTTEFGEPHAWFAGYSYEGREDLPDIAVVVMVENIGEGSDWAAPIFRRIMETYFRGGPRTPFPWESRLWVRATPEPEDGEENGTPEP
jgi:penicillin-binding protein 2